MKKSSYATGTAVSMILFQFHLHEVKSVLKGRVAQISSIALWCGVHVATTHWIRTLTIWIWFDLQLHFHFFYKNSHRVIDNCYTSVLSVHWGEDMMLVYLILEHVGQISHIFLITCIFLTVHFILIHPV